MKMYENKRWRFKREDLEKADVEEVFKEYMMKDDPFPISDIFPVKVEPFRMWVDSETKQLKDNKLECRKKIDQQLDEFENDIKKKTADTSDAAYKLGNEIMSLYEIAQKFDIEIMNLYEQIMQECDIVDDLGFATARILSEDNNALADKILEQAQQRLTFDHLLAGQRLLPDLQNKLLPVFIPWQNAEERTPGHILITCDNLNKNKALELARNLVVRMLAAFHPGLVRLSFLDPQKSGEAAIFIEKMKDVSELYYKEVMSSDEKIAKHIELLNSKIDERQKILPAGCSLAEYNRNHKETPYEAIPYEVVVIFDFQSMANNNSRLATLINSGAKHGIYLLVVSAEIPSNNYRYDQLDEQKFIRINANAKDFIISYLDSKEPEIFLPIDDRLQPLTINGQISPALDRYFEKMPAALKKRNEANKVNTDLEQLFLDKEFEKIDEKGFSVPIGVSGNKPFNFELDQTGNTHTFILGKPGSGKSVLLHDILTAAVLKYSPEELNLYLMDFKKGGVEFNSYAPKNGIANADAIPHVKAALLDGCDRQVVLEILRDIENEMKRRGKLFDNAGKSKLSEYNAMAEEKREKRLPTIILAVDECHLLFSTNDEHQKNINQIVENIATEGRSQGIHFIFATQTLAGWEIPTKIMKTISNRFVLNADPADARHLLDDEKVEVELRKLEKYSAIYRTDKDKELRMIKPGYIEKERLDELMQNLCEKAKRENLFSQEKQFIFRGAWEPSVAEPHFEQLCREKPMTIGVKFTLDKEPLPIPILKKDGGDNLLIIGNQEKQDGEAARNALRIVTVSLLSLMEYYKQNNKPYKILIINYLDADENKELNEGLNVLKSFAAYKDCKFIEGQDSVEKTFVELWQRINSKDTAQPDTFLYILGTQSFRALKYDDELNPPVISYSKCLEKILSNGAPYGIHTVLQTDKKDNLYLKDSYNIKKFFKYMVLLGMPRQEANSLTKMDLSTDTLPTEKERLKAIFFNDAVSKSTTFVPYALPEKEYVEQKINK